MSKIIFSPLKMQIINEFFQKTKEKKFNNDPKLLYYLKTLDDLKSFQPAPSGMKWSAEEKASFEKLSFVDKKKYLINKMGFQGGVILPHLKVESLYEYPAIQDDIGKDQYSRAQNLLSSSNKSFPNMDKSKQEEILNHLREAAYRNGLIAMRDLGDLLLSRINHVEERQGIKDIKESFNQYLKLIRAGSPDGYYGYYAVYRFTQDKNKLFYSSLTPKEVGVNEMLAAQYLNEAIKLGHKQALYDLAETAEGSSIAVDMYITIGYLYQDRYAFSKAMRSASYDINRHDYEIFYIACMRMSIMLGGSLDELIACYANNVSVHSNPIREDELRQYAKNRKLVDGLDPYFDEYFPPDLVLDFGTQFYGNMYGGTSDYPGIYRWIKTGKMKDPRDKDSTQKTVQDFYDKLWQIILWKYGTSVKFKQKIVENYFTRGEYVSHLLYRKYSSGFASARPYVFPKEVLATKIDYNKIPPKDLV
ncbi:MAG: hypothetical protein K2N11_06380 [Mucispirillum sp.]|nr:hypothetical protein [Mucispirillum sp.]